MPLRTLVAFVLFNTANPTFVAAQDGSRAYMEVTLGANFLLRNGPYDGEYYYRGAPMAFLAFGTQPDSTRSFLAAFQIGLLDAIGGGSDVCRFTPLGGCYEQYPLAGIIAITLGGRPLTGAWRSFEVTAGPAYIGHYEGGRSYGVLAVGRIGRGPGHYLAAGLSFVGVVTTLDGHLVLAGGIGFSLRTW